MGEQQRVAEGRQEHGRAERHAARAGGGGGEEGERLEARAREERVAHPHRVVARGFRALRHLDERRRFGAPRHDGFARREENADPDRLAAHGAVS